MECRNPHVGLRPKFFRNFLSEFSHFWRAQRSDRGAGHIRKRRTAESIVFVGTRKKIPESLLRTSDRCLGAAPGVGRGRCRRVFGTRWRFGAAALPHLLQKVRLCFGSEGTTGAIFFLRCTRARIEGRKLPLLAIDLGQRRWQPLEQMGTRASKSDFQKHCYTTNETEQNTKVSKIIKKYFAINKSKATML